MRARFSSLRLSLIPFCMLAWGVVSAAHAQPITDESQLDALLPQGDMLAEIRRKIDAKPNNLDNYYTYAKIAKSHDKLNEAVWAYRAMLAREPSLDRVRLDLSLVEIQRGYLSEARDLLQTVSAHNPPEIVQQNIGLVLGQLDRIEGMGHRMEGSLSIGVNSDSNANAAPSSGNVTVLDTTVPLGAGARSHPDLQAFAAVGFNHAYGIGNIGNNWLMAWKSGANAYTTRQQDLDALEVQLYGVRTGPEFIYAPLKLRIALELSYNQLMLDQQAYLRDPRADLTVEMPLDPTLILQYGHAVEYRDFLNSETVSTYRDRAGQASQDQIGLRYLSSPRSQWDAQITLRHEEARQAYYANDQVGLSVGNTYAFSDEMLSGILQDVFTTVRVGRKMSDYQAADPFVGSTVRRDHENSYQFGIGKKFGPNLMIMGGASYTQVISNIQNYRYDNTRYTVSLTKNF